MMEGASVHFAKAFESIGIEDTSDLTKANKVTLNALKEDGKRAAGKLFQLERIFDLILALCCC